MVKKHPATLPSMQILNSCSILHHLLSNSFMARYHCPVMEIEHIFWSLIWLRFFHIGAKLILLFNLNIHDIFFSGYFILSKFL